MLFVKDSEKRGMWDLCAGRLLGYADSFDVLAKSFRGDYVEPQGDRQEILEAHKKWENRQVIYANLHEMSEIMTQMAGEVACYEMLNEGLFRLLIRGLKAEGVGLVSGYYVPDYPSKRGRKSLVLTLYAMRERELEAEKVVQILSKLLHKSLKLSVISPYVINQEKRSYIFVEKPTYVAITGYAKVPKDGEKVSGDNYAVFELQGGKTALVLSDGTGSGEGACNDSGEVLDLMEHLLEAGYLPEAAVNLTNMAVFAKEKVLNHPTLDMCYMDLYLGQCEFRKAGAAQSFIKRGGYVEEIKGGNLPLGIFQKTQSISEQKQLEDGDLVVMVSDGVVEAYRKQQNLTVGGKPYLQEPESVAEELRQIQMQNPGIVAERVLQRAIFLSGGHITDDMTVLVAGIWKS